MPIDSRNKGAAYERHIRDRFNEHGYATRRGYAAVGEPDIVGAPGIHIEAKAREKIDLESWMDQSIRDSQKMKDGIPIVIHKRNRKPDKVTMLLEDFFKLYEAYVKEIIE